jgi:Bacterial protein of unknown function (DUF922)
MGGVRVGILGTDADAGADIDTPIDVLGGGDRPGTLGGGSVPRIIASVTKDWDETSPVNTAPLVVSGKTIAQVARALNALPEWGRGGGRLSVDRIPSGTSSDLTITLHANLERRMPEWTDYQNASTAAQTEWNHMFRKLVDHEDQHVHIAVEEAEQLAKDLVGHDISDIASMVTVANGRMAKRQKQLDDATDHGARTGVQYGDVSLDITIV